MKKLPENFWYAAAFVLAALLIMVSKPSEADDLIIGGFSKHFDAPFSAEKFNETNYLIGYKRDYASILAFKNSYNQTSVAALAHLEDNATKNLRIGLAAGLATGYEKSDSAWAGEITPVAYLTLDVHPAHDKYGVTLSLVPSKFVSINFRIKL